MGAGLGLDSGERIRPFDNLAGREEVGDLAAVQHQAFARPGADPIHLTVMHFRLGKLAGGLTP